MLRKSLLYLSHQPQIFRFVRNNGLAKRFASRFVAGETIATACDAVAELKARGIAASLDLLGESVTNAAEARETARQYLELLDEMQRRGLELNVSVKLTALGQDIDDALCEENIRAILAKAGAQGGFVRLDMEGSPYTQRTLDFFEQKLRPGFPDTVGVVLQSALRRTLDDVQWSIERQCRVRICKGAYLEPATVAFPAKKDVDANYVMAMHRLMEHGNYPGLATHDEAIIAEAVRFAKAKGIAPERFEFQMLYGVRRDLQEQLVRDGWRMRVYVPFGTQWYPYLMRRLAERPANLAFITGNVMKEMVKRR
ncbi:MAG: proline dehydrogenase family protein [Gemmatimonadaceae bacterium]|nr:proline dehydrogenase family protein [Gemmatimonadaceae bacterium]MCW5827565.1 proline dehydrogenase family protein [Gemmatimonadaceae bacterium]